MELNPNPAGQSYNVPALDGIRLHGIQHKYRETVLFFLARVKHAMHIAHFVSAGRSSSG